MENYTYYYPYNPNAINHDNKPPPSSSSTSKNMKIKSNNNNHNGGKRAPPKLSTDPQSVAARERRHRISDRFKILQTLVPGGTKLDTVSLLEHAIHYVKFLKAQIWLHQAIITPKHVSMDDHASNYDGNNLCHGGDYDCNYGVNDVIYPSYDSNRVHDHDEVMYYDQSYDNCYGLINGNDSVNHDYQGESSSYSMMMGTSHIATALERGMPNDFSSVSYQMDVGSYDHHESLCFDRSFNYC